MPTTSTARELMTSDRCCRFFERCDRPTQAYLEVNFRAPSQQCPRERYVGAASHRIVRSRFADLHGVRNARRLRNRCRKLRDGDFSRVSEVNDATAGLIVGRRHQNAAHHILDEAERPRLLSIAINRERSACERLSNEIRDHAPISNSHPRTVRVEDPDDSGIYSVRSHVGHDHGLAEAFPFVVTGSGPDWIYVSPVGFALRMLERIAIYFGSGRVEQSRIEKRREAAA